MSCRLLIALAVQDAVVKSSKSHFFFTLSHFNDIKMKKMKKSDFLGSGYPTDLYPSDPTVEIKLVKVATSTLSGIGVPVTH